MDEATTRRWFFGATLAGAGSLPAVAAALNSDTTAPARSPVSVSIHDFAGQTGAAKLQAALDGGASEILIPDKVSIAGTVTSNGNVRLHGPGTLDLTDGGHIRIGSGVRQISDLGADIGVFDTTVTFAAPHGLVPGDVFCVWNPADYSWAPYRPYYRAGDMYRVAEVLSSTMVRIYGVAQEAFAAAAVQVYRLTGGWFEMFDITVIPCQTGVPLDIDGCKDIRLDGVRIPAGADYVGININRSYNIGITDPQITALVSDAYPIMIGNSQRVTVNATRGLYSRRHCLALGGGGMPGSVPCADIRIIGMIAENIASSGIGAADIHGCCKRVVYESCILSMANMAGEDVTYRNCYITGAPPSAEVSGTVVYGTEAVGGLFTIENCHLVSVGRGSEWGSHVHIGVTQRTRPFRLRLKNNIYENVGPSPGGCHLIVVDLASSTPRRRNPPIDVEIDGVTYIGSEPPEILFSLRDTEDVKATCSVRIRNVTGVKRLYGASTNYDIAFEGPGLKSGVTAYGDVSPILARDTATASLLFSTPLTADRLITLPAATDCGAGDEILISRAARGAFGLNVGGLKTLAAGEWCRVAYTGGPAIGRWALMASGRL